MPPLIGFNTILGACGMRPEDDYINWAAIFLSVIAPGDCYVDMIGDMTRLMRDFRSNNGLTGNLAQHSDTFLNETVPRACEQLLSMNPVNTGEMERISDFLIELAGLTAWKITHNSGITVYTFIHAFSHQSKFYTGNLRYWEEVVEYFVRNHRGLYLSPQENNIELPGYMIMFLVLSAISQNTQSKLSTQVVDELYPPLLEAFDLELDSVFDTIEEKKERIKLVNTDMLSCIMDVFLSVKIDLAVKQQTLGVKLAKLLVVCLKCQFVQKQMFGAKYLSKFVEFSSLFEFVRPHLTEKTLTKFVSEQFHSEVLEQLRMFFVRLTEMHILTVEQIRILLATGRRYTVSQRAKHFEIVACVMRKMRSEERRQLVELIVQDADDYIYSFLHIIIRDIVSVDEKLAGVVVEALIEGRCQGITEPGEALKLLCVKLLPDNLVVILTRGCFRLVREGYGEFACSLFRELMKVASAEAIMPSEEFLLEIENLSTTRREWAFAMVPYYFERSNATLEMLQKISTIRDDSLWNLFKLLVKQVFRCKDERLAFLVETAKEVGCQNVTKSLVEFMIEVWFLEHWNQIQSNGKANKMDRWTLSPAVRFETVNEVFFEDAYFKSKDREGSKCAGHFLLKIHKNVTVSHFREVGESVKQIYKRHLSSENDTERERTVSLLYDVIARIELGKYNTEDWGRRRFESLGDPVRLKIDIDGTPFVIHECNTYKTLDEIRQRIAYHKQVPPSAVQFTGDLAAKSGGITVSDIKCDTISCHVSDLTSQWEGPETLPSLVFHEDELAFVLLEVIDDEGLSFARSIWRLVKVLPCDQDKLNKVADFSSYMKEVDDSGPFKQRYMLKILLWTLKNESQRDRFVKQGCHCAVARLLGADNPMIYGEVLGLLATISCFDDLNCYELVSSIGAICFEDISTKAVVLACKLLGIIAVEHQRTVSSYIEENFAEICSLLIPKQIKEVLDNFLELVVKVCPERAIYDECCSRFDKSPFFISLFAALISETELGEKIPADEIISQYERIIDSKNPCISEVNAMFLSVVKKIDGINDKLGPIAKKLVKFAFNTSKNKLRKSIFDVLSELTAHDSLSNKMVNKSLVKLFTTMIDRWNYNPKLFKRRCPLTGLRNLGATCFVNAILQQLFYVFPFRYLFMTHEFPEDSELTTLQDLFVHMLYTEEGHVDTSNFLGSWHGWFGEVLNPKEQQDAGEFLQVLLDQLPEETAFLFKGSLRSTLDGIEKPVHNTTTETFWTLGVTVKGFSRLEDSIKDLASEEIITDYEVDKQRISVRKTTKISEAPPVLFVLLRRFEYQLQTGHRFKIDDRFEFPLQLDLNELASRKLPKGKNLYNLVGIVMHRGNALHGHYFSYVQTNGLWYKCDDNETTECSESDVLGHAYGDYTTSAYILLYEQGSFHLTKPVDLSFEETFDFKDQLNLAAVERDNARFRLCQSLFQKSTFDFVCRRNNFDVFVRYFVHIFCHSRLASYADQFYGYFSKFMNDFEKKDRFLSYISDRFDDVSSDISHCVVPESSRILDIMVCIISSCFSEENLLAQSRYFCSMVLDALVDAADDCLHICYFLSILSSFWEKVSHSHELMQEWGKKLVRFLERVYTVERHPMYYQQINFGSVFSILHEIVIHGLKLHLEFLSQNSDRVILSPHHQQEFIALLMTSIRGGSVAAECMLQLLDKCTNENTVCEFAAFAIAQLNKDDVDTVLKTTEKLRQKVKPESVISALTSKCNDAAGRTLAEKIVEYTPDLMEYYLLGSLWSIRVECEKLFTSIFPRFTPVDEMTVLGNRNPAFCDCERFAHQLVERLDAFITSQIDQNPCPGVIHDEGTPSSVPHSSEFTLCSIIRIWHFVAKGANLMTNERFVLVQQLIHASILADVWPNYQLVSLVHFFLDFPKDIVNEVIVDESVSIFSTVVQRSMELSLFAPMLMGYLVHLPQWDQSVAEDILSTEQFRYMIDQCLTAGDNRFESAISRIAVFEKPRARMIERLSSSNKWLSSSMFNLWKVVNRAKALVPGEVTGIVNRCLAKFTGSYATIQTQAESIQKLLLEYVSFLTSIEGPTEDDSTGHLEVDWERLLKALKNSSLYANPYKLISWCCTHNHEFLESFLDHYEDVMCYSADPLVRKSMLKACIRGAITTQRGETVVNIFKKLISPFVENVATFSEPDFALASNCVSSMVDPNLCWMTPLFEFFISKPYMKLLQNLHMLLAQRLTPERCWAIYEPILTQVSQCLTTNTEVPSSISRIFAALWISQPDLQPEIADKIHLTPDNTPLFNTTPWLRLSLPVP